MKSQLLEDMVDSQSSLSPPLNDLPVRAAAPPAVVPAAPAQGTAARARAGVWRARAPQPASLWRPRPPAPHPAAPPPEPSDPPLPEWPPARPEPSLPAPEVASFSSREPDWVAPLKPAPAPWTERWGRKAFGWSLALIAAVAVAAIGAWMVDDTRVESNLALVADHSPAPVSSPPAPEAAAEAPPPLRLLPLETPVAAVAEAVPVNVSALTELPPVGAAPTAKRVEPEAPSIMKKPEAKPPMAKRTQERRVATAPVKRAPAAEKKPPAKKDAKPKPPSEQLLARALADAQRSRQESLARPGLSAETLRLCRAAGYHANACLKRACEATRFGLVCRG